MQSTRANDAINAKLSVDEADISEESIEPPEVHLESVASLQQSSSRDLGSCYDQSCPEDSCRGVCM